MVLYVVCGVLLSIFILYKSNCVGCSKDFSNVDKSRRNILQEICKDLTYLFKSQKSNNGKFIGTLTPLNDIDKILDNLLIVEDKESFTINKKVIHLCTKEPKSGKYYDKNILMYVVLHELSHVLCNDIGHTENFYVLNKALLDYAITHGLYDNSKPFINNYCPLN
jgi:hypothetical protein